MPKNVMKLLKPSPHRARNDFDLSHRHVLDANFGELLPVSCIETVPGDTIVMHASDLLRNIPFVTSPFLRARQHLDVWFVPYRDLWHQFDAFITRKKQPVSSAYNGANYLPWFRPYRVAYDLNQTSEAWTDIAGRPLTKRSLYLLELLGYGRQKYDSQRSMSTNDPACNPFRLAAYNYIWYNEYRQQYYDDGMRLLNGSGSSTYNNAAVLFNFDDLSCDTEAGAKLEIESGIDRRLLAMCQMRYRTWKKDLFTGLLPSTQFGVLSTFGVNSIVTLLSQGESTSFPADAGVSNNGYLNNQNANANGSRWELRGVSGQNSFDILALRKSEAVQIWRENALRAGNHIKDNMIAHYGVASDFQDHRPVYLGSVSAPLNISDVMATADTDSVVNGHVGSIAGKGLSSLSEKVFKYNAKEFGVIMVMFSILPEAEYDADMFDRPNQLLDSEDFFIPEYENLGLEAVGKMSIFDAHSVSTHNSVLGFAPRYYGYKTKLDKVFGEFVGTGVFRRWTSQRYDVASYFADLSPTVMPLQLLYVNPKIFDINFNVGADVEPQFLCDFYFDVDAVRPMSVTGMPFS